MGRVYGVIERRLDRRKAKPRNWSVGSRGRGWQVRPSQSRSGPRVVWREQEPFAIAGPEQESRTKPVGRRRTDSGLSGWRAPRLRVVQYWSGSGWPWRWQHTDGQSRRRAFGGGDKRQVIAERGVIEPGVLASITNSNDNGDCKHAMARQAGIMADRPRKKKGRKQAGG